MDLTLEDLEHIYDCSKSNIIYLKNIELLQTDLGYSVIVLS